MALKSEMEEILEAAVAGIPRVAETIVEIPIEHRARALDAAERSYLQTAQGLGHAEAASRKLVSAVMLRLRGEVAKRGLAKQKVWNALYEELCPPGLGRTRIM